MSGGDRVSSAILVAVDGPLAGEWFARFRDAAPNRDIRLWPHATGNPGEVGYACAWRPPHGLLAQYPNLRAIFSLAAGVDHLLADSTLPDVPLYVVPRLRKDVHDLAGLWQIDQCLSAAED